MKMNDANELLKHHIAQSERAFDKMDRRFDGIDEKLETLNNERLIRIGAVSVLGAFFGIVSSLIIALFTK